MSIFRTLQTNESNEINDPDDLNDLNHINALNHIKPKKPDTTDSQPRRMLDVSKAEREFGFKARTSFETGLKRTMDWYLSTKKRNRPDEPNKPGKDHRLVYFTETNEINQKKER